mmetsp:Transcript_49491/g.112339  ORF Transcript_49491/g.112339 Transcript_49491/m.112339 type:complete len:291 (+) Transcript_49491:191-1063(+)
MAVKNETVPLLPVSTFSPFFLADVKKKLSGEYKFLDAVNPLFDLLPHPRGHQPLPKTLGELGDEGRRGRVREAVPARVLSHFVPRVRGDHLACLGVDEDQSGEALDLIPRPKGLEALAVLVRHRRPRHLGQVPLVPVGGSGRRRPYHLETSFLVVLDHVPVLCQHRSELPAGRAPIGGEVEPDHGRPLKSLRSVHAHELAPRLRVRRPRLGAHEARAQERLHRPRLRRKPHAAACAARLPVGRCKGLLVPHRGEVALEGFDQLRRARNPRHVREVRFAELLRLAGGVLPR